MKNREEIINYCLTFKDTYPDQPFHDTNWTVIRHRGSRKVFAWIFEREGHTWVNVKCSPEWRDFWRQVYPAVIPAYHLNKTHWNSVILDGTIPEEEVKRMIGESYDLTAPVLRKKKPGKGKDKQNSANLNIEKENGN